MTEISERRVFFAFTKVFAIVALLVSAFLLPISAQVDTAEESAARPEGIRAKYLSFYGTGRADWATVTPAAAAGNPIVWKIRKNQAGPEVSSTFNFGLFGDTIAPGSYTGDVTFDPAISRANPGFSHNHWIDPFDNGPGVPYTVIPFGTAGDNYGRNADYDGDGIEDSTIIRVVSNVLHWWIRPSSNPSATRVIPFGNLVAGQTTLAFEGADLTGVGRDEIVVVRVLNATGATTWFVGDAVTGVQILQVNWGNFNTDYVINPADYTGDGIDALVVFRAGVAAGSPDAGAWFIRNTATGMREPIIHFGITDPNFVDQDLPVRGDYDGDGRDDIAIWRPSTQTFWVRASSNGSLIIQQWGAAGDFPLGHLFVF